MKGGDERKPVQQCSPMKRGAHGYQVLDSLAPWIGQAERSQTAGSMTEQRGLMHIPFLQVGRQSPCMYPKSFERIKAGMNVNAVAIFLQSLHQKKIKQWRGEQIRDDDNSAPSSALESGQGEGQQEENKL